MFRAITSVIRLSSKRNTGSTGRCNSRRGCWQQWKTPAQQAAQQQAPAQQASKLSIWYLSWVSGCALMAQAFKSAAKPRCHLRDSRPILFGSSPLLSSLLLSRLVFRFNGDRLGLIVSPSQNSKESWSGKDEKLSQLRNCSRPKEKC